jgi:hypothetical protein
MTTLSGKQRAITTGGLNKCEMRPTKHIFNPLSLFLRKLDRFQEAAPELTALTKLL